MRTALAILLASSIAFAEEPLDSPTLAPDLPGVSVRLRPGEAAPFDGRLVALDENLRRGQSLVECRAELASAKENAWLPKPVLIAVVIGGVVLGAAAGAAVTYAATR